ncbi:hypothetical protein WJX81_002055 [Elliptochloris bilobata]|uniref:glucose-1-phosphate adenylyltransferase n=1 Tax=Elliptochloris bilobata TaxID=381761 RepID=A0AAW1SC24_9CHLO
MPSVELGCNTQLIDVTISNCIRSGINKLNVLTQFNSHMLNTHLTNAYPPAVLGGPARTGFVDVLACHQTPQFSSWYRGSADAVRRNLPVVLEPYRGTAVPDDLLILSGQALYRMDYGQLIRTHRETGADITICTNSVDWDMASKRGLARINPESGVVESFVEKPTGDRLEVLAHASKHATPEFPFEASMGIYVFKRKALVALLAGQEDHYGENSGPDTHFGHDVIPHALRDGYRVVAHHFNGYFRDVLTLRDLYEVNLSLARPGSPISFYDVEKGIVSSAPVRPPAIIHNCDIEHTLVGEGSVLHGSTIRGCVVGNNIYVGEGCNIEDSLLLSNDFYTNDSSRAVSRAKGEAVMGVGGGSVIKKAVIDNNVAIGSRVRITNADGVQEADRSAEGFVISEGIVVVLRGTSIPDGTVI